MRALLRLCAALTALSPSAHAATGLGLPGASPSTCDSVPITADSATCDRDICRLEGNAHVSCGTMTLWADRIDILMDNNQHFNGAQGVGNVLLVDGLSVVHCRAITLDADRIKGRIDTATIEVRKPNPTFDSNGIPQGRNQAVIHGTINRLDALNLAVDHGDMTLCDCGEGKAPSWRLDASTIDITLGERATIWAPMLRINTWGNFMLPITPPLLPLSLPLKKRAAGFLPPAYTFFASPWPTLDFPFFMPLGNAYDLLLSPGVRMDWTGSHAGGMHRLGAPRFGTRFRYAPTATTRGQFNAQFTYDVGRGMAQAFLAQQPGNYLANPINADQYTQRRDLVARVAVDWAHHTALSRQMDWLVDAHWVSDDLVNQDFLVNPATRVAVYIPSRTQILLRDPQLTGVLAADSMLRLNSTKFLAGQTVANLSNVNGAERTTLHRAPYLELNLTPTALPLALVGDAKLTLVRYGNWTGAAPETPTDVQQTLAGLAAGVGYNHQVGPVELTARAGLDSLLVDTQGLPAFVSTIPLLGADAVVRVGRRFGDMVHTVAPRLSYRGVPTVWASSALGLAAQQAALDERLLRRDVEQGMLVLQQALWRRHGGGEPLLALDLAQPWDMGAGVLLQPWARLSWDLPWAGRASAWTSIDPRASNNDPVREIGVQWFLPLGPFKLDAQYTRLGPNADRFQRSIYELSAPFLPPSPISAQQSEPDWAHVLRATAAVRYGDSLDVAYTTAYQLPRPGHGEDPGYIDPSCRLPDGTGGRQCFTQHVVTLNYTSPCQCWGINTMVTVLPQDPHHPRFQINLTIADYRVGMAGNTNAAASNLDLAQ